MLPTPFIDAIRQNPDEDAPRLIAADWLDEQGGDAARARAEFIRVQIERANLPAADARQSELQARELRLLKQYAKTWQSSHFVFRKCEFRRGFIERVHLHLNHFQHHRRQMFALEPVRNVRLTGFYRAPDQLIDRVAQCEELRDLETLHIHHQGPHHEAHGNVLSLLRSPHLQSLKELDLLVADFDRSQRQAYEKLPLLKQLEKLRFPYLSRYPNDPGDWFSDSLTLGPIKDWQPRSLGGLSLPLLEKMVRAPFWDMIEEFEPVEFYGPGQTYMRLLGENCPRSLKQLVIPYADELEQLEPLLDVIGECELRECRIYSAISAKQLGWLLEDQPGLKTLRMNLLSKKHAEILSASSASLHLERLLFSTPDHSKEDIFPELFKSLKLPRLTQLSAYCQKITSKGIDALAKSPVCGQLRCLSLSRSAFSPTLLERLLDKCNLNQLTQLRIVLDSNQRYSETLMEKFLELPNLTTLYVEGYHTDDIESWNEIVGSKLPWFMLSPITTQDEYRARSPELSPSTDVELTPL